MTYSSNVTDIRQAFLDFFTSKEHHILPSSSLVPQNDPTLMFANAGMNQFKNVFSGAEIIKDQEGNPITRATTSQKCVRAGGKHNDLDNVGYTARHHTFFEMLGNFSFGDYFKEDAIAYAWEFLTSPQWMNLPKDKLWITIYHTDNEAFDLWKKIAGLDDERIIRIATKDNFWEMGDTGPCGPCSEIFYDHGEQYWGDKPGTPDEDGDRYIEIWNLVFMQFEKLPDGTQIDLPKPCIDTGMGLERMAAVKQHVNNNYETDLFKKLIEESLEKTGEDHPGAITSHRVIADHLRSSCFLIADGVLPSNEGRGYVLRRIMRRGMRHAHLLGCHEPLMYQLAPILIDLMGSHFSELERTQDLIIETLRHEEEKFKVTLSRGLALLDDELQKLYDNHVDNKDDFILSGDVAFKLYDTYGFPLDLTEDYLRPKHARVDKKGFNACMAEQKAKARAAWSGSGDAGTDKLWFELEQQFGATEFLGYDKSSAQGQILAIIKDGQQVNNATKNDTILILTNQTPFYAESGGQAGDYGTLHTDSAKATITDTKKHIGKLHVHYATITEGNVQCNDTVTLTIDTNRRNALRANHSATHLLHAALRNVLGDHVTQKGSLVEADYFRFDFSHNKGLSAEEITKIEDIVNAQINQKSTVKTALMTPDQAIESGAMALFGEKYGDEVRVLTMGTSGTSPFSVELCGGTHVTNTGDIEQFKVIKESSVASGIRRIEGKTAQSVDLYLQEEAQRTKAEAERQKQLAAEKSSKAAEAGNARKDYTDAIQNAPTLDNITYHGMLLSDIHPKELRAFVDDFKKQIDNGITVIITENDGKAGIVAGVTDSLTNQFSAVDLVRIGSALLGGKGGGGRADFAQAGGTSVENATQALDAIQQAITEKQ